MTKRIMETRPSSHEHEWTISDPFNFDGPIFECRCGEKRVELDKTPIPGNERLRQTPRGSWS